jgi:hypothetical protein
MVSPGNLPVPVGDLPARPCPGGTLENSPAIDRWVDDQRKFPSRVGVKENVRARDGVLSSLAGLALRPSADPPMNRRAIFFRPIGL